MSTKSGQAHIGSAVGASVEAVGAAKIALGVANVNRGARQINESLNDSNGASAKNLLGLAPFGQKFDDPDEPSPGEFFMQKVDQFVTNPAKAATRVFAVDEEKER